MATAVAMEGVNKAYELAKMFGDEKRMACYSNYINEGKNYILSIQITDSDDIRAVGGFRGSKKSATMRVDRNQHAAFALIDAYEMGILE
jgi:hypothetical protein